MHMHVLWYAEKHITSCTEMKNCYKHLGSVVFVCKTNSFLYGFNLMLSCRNSVYKLTKDPIWLAKQLDHIQNRLKMQNMMTYKRVTLNAMFSLYIAHSSLPRMGKITFYREATLNYHNV